ncbi:MAG: hypothetical protein AAFP26_04025 [Planctomycetota bacterium]
MHILTKVFVVLSALLAVLMGSLAVSYTVNTDRIIQDYSNARNAAAAAEAALGAASAAAQSKEAADQEQIARLRQEKADLEANVRSSESEISKLTIAERESRSALERLQSNIGQFGVSSKTQAELISSYKDEVERLRNDELRWRNEKLDLEAALSDLESQRIVYEQTQRALQEQLAEANRAIASLRGGTSIAGVGTPTEIPGPPVRGFVQNVRVEPATGDTIVRINLGSNDRVSQNSRLYLNRNGRVYLGDLVIFEVDLNHAIGRLVNSQGSGVSEGDQVWSRLGG